MVDRATVLQRSNRASHREVGGQMVVVVGNRQELHVLNRVGGLVWELLDGERSVGDMSDAVARRFGQETSAVEADVLAFANELLTAGAVTVRGDG